jgi:hypothetical protein
LSARLTFLLVALVFLPGKRGRNSSGFLKSNRDGWIEAMASDYARRGRPRGSGLDDRVQLSRIAELIEADPALKPTTAIKAIGVTDPSTIRRLREKLKGDAQPHAALRGDAGPSVLPHSGGELSAAPQSPSPSSSTGAAALAGQDASMSQVAWLSQWCALGLSAVSSTVEAQIALMDEFLSVPQVASALRHQLLFNEVAKAFCPKRSDARSTLH